MRGVVAGRSVKSYAGLRVHKGKSAGATQLQSGNWHDVYRKINKQMRIK